MFFIKRSFYILILLVFIANYQSCGFVMPNTNHMLLSKKGDTAINTSLGLLGLNDSQPLPVYILSYQMKTQDDVSYEFFLIGVRRIDEIANGTGFYFNIYESISFPVVYFSGGIGFLAGYRSSMLNFYVSSRLDAYFATGLMDDYVGGLLTYTPSIGLAFTKGKQKFFIEASILKGLYEKILKINDKGDSSESSQDIYFVNLGVSF